MSQGCCADQTMLWDLVTAVLGKRILLLLIGGIGGAMPGGVRCFVEWPKIDKDGKYKELVKEAEIELRKVMTHVREMVESNYKLT